MAMSPRMMEGVDAGPNNMAPMFGERRRELIGQCRLARATRAVDADHHPFAGVLPGDRAELLEHRMTRRRGDRVRVTIETRRHADSLLDARCEAPQCLGPRSRGNEGRT